MNHQMSQLFKLNWLGSLITMSPCHISFLVLLFFFPKLFLNSNILLSTLFVSKNIVGLMTQDEKLVEGNKYLPFDW